MSTLKFKTNIKCTGCIAKATPVLDEKLGKGNWDVDWMNPKKTLTVTSPNIDESDVVAFVNEAGFTAESLN